MVLGRRDYGSFWWPTILEAIVCTFLISQLTHLSLGSSTTMLRLMACTLEWRLIFLLPNSLCELSRMTNLQVTRDLWDFC